MTLARVSLLAMFALIAGQGTGNAGASRVVEGRVVKPAGAGTLRPLAGTWVVLHRVGSDTSRPLDSVRTRADGTYRIAYRAFGVGDAIYFVAVRHDGVAYFAPPLEGAVVTGANAEIMTYDTASSGAPIHERGRHVIIFAPEASGARRVVEVYELENVGSTTRVAAGIEQPVWRAAIPDAASAFRAGENSFSAAAISGGAGKVELYAPLAPGVQQVTFSYAMPVSAFPLRLPPASDSVVLEVLLEQKGETAVGAGLRRADSVTVDGHRLSRWLSTSAPRNAVVTIGVAAASADRANYAVAGLVVAIAGAMLAALIVARRRAS